MDAKDNKFTNLLLEEKPLAVIAINRLKMFRNSISNFK
jgi:hypothetical protein